MKQLLIIAVCLLMSVSSAHAVPADGMPCHDGSGRIIHAGDSIINLIECAGEPMSKSSKEVVSASIGTAVKQFVEEWYYSVDGFGYKITVVNGTITSIVDTGR